MALEWKLTTDRAGNRTWAAVDDGVVCRIQNSFDTVLFDATVMGNDANVDLVFGSLAAAKKWCAATVVALDFNPDRE